MAANRRYGRAYYMIFRFMLSVIASPLPGRFAFKLAPLVRCKGAMQLGFLAEPFISHRGSGGALQGVGTIEDVMPRNYFDYVPAIASFLDPPDRRNRYFFGPSWLAIITPPLCDDNDGD
uniref:Uncharacterized protein n=1 Tax=Trichuris muris TaxID=70415 RepID=A0A5S6QCQ2_TRIMR